MRKNSGVVGSRGAMIQCILDWTSSSSDTDLKSEG